jgi:hypothetical protein
MSPYLTTGVVTSAALNAAAISAPRTVEGNPRKHPGGDPMNEADLRERVRALLKETNPDDPGVSMVDFRGAQFDRGLAWVHFPEGHGGLDLNAKLQTVVYDELQKGATTFYEPLGNNPIGIGMGAPVVNTYASEEQKNRLLRKIFTGEEIWCQLFSEPSAGSDVAGLATRAERDGDDWILNGQKVWTTLAHVSRWGMLLARTNPNVPKHDGLSYFLLDMKSPGVEVRPLYQITGEAEFNEVFMSDVRIPGDRILGKEGQGWRVAITTLMNERSALGGGSSRKGGGPIKTHLPARRHPHQLHRIHAAVAPACAEIERVLHPGRCQGPIDLDPEAGNSFVPDCLAGATDRPDEPGRVIGPDAHHAIPDHGAAEPSRRMEDGADASAVPCSHGVEQALDRGLHLLAGIRRLGGRGTGKQEDQEGEGSGHGTSGDGWRPIADTICPTPGSASTRGRGSGALGHAGRS